MRLNHFEIDVIWTAFQGFLKLHTHISVFWDFRVFVFVYRPENENPEITENLYFWVYKVQMDMDLFFDLYFNFLSAKTEINKNNNKRLNLINLDGSKALKRQKYDTWLAISLDHFEIDVIWEAFREFLKLNSHISVFWSFWWISVISEFSLLGIGLKTKTRELPKIFSFFFSGYIKWIFVYIFLYF